MRNPTVFRALKAIGPLSLVVIAAALVLMIVAVQVDLREVYTGGFNGAMNDQLNYIVVARHIAAGDGITSGIIFPSVLRQHATKSCFYMPGHYLATAASFCVLGYSALSAFLPNVFSFVGSALLIFLIAKRLYGIAAAGIAVALFVMFPINGILAWSAMSEMTLILASLASLWLFLLIPQDKRPWLGPFLIILPLLFRETGPCVAAPMCALVLRPPKADRIHWHDAMKFALLTVVVFLGVMKSPIANGRPSLLINNLAGVRFDEIYTDAFAMDSVDRSPENLCRLVAAKYKRNLASLKSPVEPGSTGDLLITGERKALWFILAGFPLGLALWVLRRDWFAAGVALSIAVLLVMVLLFYTVWFYRAVRVMLMMQPLVAMLFGSVWQLIYERFRWGALAFALLIAIPLFRHHSDYITAAYVPQERLDALDQRAEQFMESLSLDKQKVVATSPYLIFRYLVDQFPVTYSFVPANMRTMKLLEQRHPVGAVLLFENAGVPEVTPDELIRDGFVLDRTVDFSGAKIRVMKSRSR